MDILTPIPPRIIAAKRVDIVDSDLTTCEALSVLFRLEGFQTRFFVDPAQFASNIEPLSPDVVVLNLASNGISVLRRIKTTLLGVPVIMIASNTDLDGAILAMKYGATDVLSTPIDAEHLLFVVRDALRRDVHLGAMQGGRRPVEVRGFSQLTAREREVLQLLTNGQSNKEAAQQLGISPRTIEVHRGRVMEKLGAKNSSDLVRIVLTS